MLFGIRKLHCALPEKSAMQDPASLEVKPFLRSCVRFRRKLSGLQHSTWG